jgi:hypothetical protein
MCRMTPVWNPCQARHTVEMVCSGRCSSRFSRNGHAGGPLSPTSAPPGPSNRARARALEGWFWQANNWTWQLAPGYLVHLTLKTRQAHHKFVVSRKTVRHAGEPPHHRPSLAPLWMIIFASHERPPIRRSRKRNKTRRANFASKPGAQRFS